MTQSRFDSCPALEFERPLFCRVQMCESRPGERRPSTADLALFNTQILEAP